MAHPQTARVVDLRRHPQAFRAILGERSTPHGLVLTLWVLDKQTGRRLDGIYLNRSYLRSFGFVERKDRPGVWDTRSYPGLSGMDTLIRAIIRFGGILLLRPPFPENPDLVADHLAMMVNRHGWARVGYIDDNRHVTVLDSSAVHADFNIGDRVRLVDCRTMGGEIVGYADLDGEEGDEIRVQRYRLDRGGPGWASTELETVREEVMA